MHFDTSSPHFFFQLSRMLDELLELVCEEITATDIDSAQAALTKLQTHCDTTSKYSYSLL